MSKVFFRKKDIDLWESFPHGCLDHLHDDLVPFSRRTRNPCGSCGTRLPNILFRLSFLSVYGPTEGTGLEYSNHLANIPLPIDLSPIKIKIKVGITTVVYWFSNIPNLNLDEGDAVHFYLISTSFVFRFNTCGVSQATKWHQRRNAMVIFDWLLS